MWLWAWLGVGGARGQGTFVRGEVVRVQEAEDGGEEERGLGAVVHHRAGEVQPAWQSEIRICQQTKYTQYSPS